MFVVIVASFFLVANPSLLDTVLPSKKSPDIVISPTSTKKVVITSQSGLTKATLNVEIADTEQKRNLGLGGRDKLDPDSGMLFVFDRPKKAQFYMKGMKITLDFIWIRGNTVVETKENVPPPVGTPNEVLPTFGPAVEVDKVLEVNAGFIKAHGIGSGDKLKQAQ